VQEVRLAEPGRRVEEQRVVSAAGVFGDGERGRVCEAVVVADDELLERVARVEVEGTRAGLGLLVVGDTARAPTLACEFNPR